MSPQRTALPTPPHSGPAHDAIIISMFLGGAKVSARLGKGVVVGKLVL